MDCRLVLQSQYYRKLVNAQVQDIRNNEKKTETIAHIIGDLLSYKYEIVKEALESIEDIRVGCRKIKTIKNSESKFKE